MLLMRYVIDIGVGGEGGEWTGWEFLCVLVNSRFCVLLQYTQMIRLVVFQFMPSGDSHFFFLFVDVEGPLIIF